MNRVGAGALALGIGLIVLACERTETTVVRGSAVDHGRALFSDPSASPAPGNDFACATCHRDPEAKQPDGKIYPGGPLDDVIARPSYWGGQEDDLLRAINHCRFFFMRAPRPWTVDDEEAQALYAWLVAIASTSTGASAPPVPFSVVRTIADLPPGDPSKGANVFASACQSCHGEVHTGRGRVNESIPVLPEDTLAEHAQYGELDRRLVFVEKVRHGGFLGYGGYMPPFSLEALPDESLSDLLALFGLYR